MQAQALEAQHLNARQAIEKDQRIITHVMKASLHNRQLFFMT